MALYILFIEQLAREKAALNKNAHYLSENQGKLFQYVAIVARESDIPRKPIESTSQCATTSELSSGGCLHGVGP